MLRRVVVGIGRGLRETGQAVERMGARAQDNWIFQEKLCRHRALMNLFDQRPKLSTGVFVAPSASVIGSVEIKDLSSVWYGAVIRGDQSSIYVGGFSSIGDRTVIQARSPCLLPPFRFCCLLHARPATGSRSDGSLPPPPQRHLLSRMCPCYLRASP